MMNKDIFVKLLQERRYKSVKDVLDVMNAVDIASLLGEFDDKELALAFRLIPKEKAADVFANMESSLQSVLVEALSEKELKEILNDLYMDDTVDLLEELPANLVTRILDASGPKERETINKLLNYPEDSAGSIMTTEYVDLKPYLTVGQALAHIKKTGIHKETIYTCYVTDAQRKLLGVIPLRTLICAEDDSLVGDLMEDDVISVHTLDDQEEVANIFKKYNWMALPVTDTEGRLVGIITVDDIVDVIEQETTEDMELMNAVLPSDDEYLKMSVFALVKNRIPWLCVLMISGTLSAFVIGMYQSLLDSVVMLSSFMTIITGTGGNAGSQASAMVIRGLALGDIQMRDTFKVVFKELRVGILCGLILAMVNMIRMTFFDHSTPFNIDLTVSISMGVAVVLAKTLGCILPILAKAVKLDPAMMAGPLISTVVDAIALVVYFSIATVLVL